MCKYNFYFKIKFKTKTNKNSKCKKGEGEGKKEKMSYQKILVPKKQGGLFPQKEEPVVAVSSQETGQRNPHRPSKWMATYTLLKNVNILNDR